MANGRDHPSPAEVPSDISPSATQKLRPRDHGKSIYIPVGPWGRGTQRLLRSLGSPSVLPPPPCRSDGLMQSPCPRIGLVRFLPPGANRAEMGPPYSVVRTRVFPGTFALLSLVQECNKLSVYCGYSTTAGCSVPIMLCVTAPGGLYGGAVSESRKGGRRAFIIGRNHEGPD